jgi:ribonuclease P protein subunit POP4
MTTAAARRIIRGELIGRDVTITAARAAGYRGLAGRITDETATMVVIDTGEGKEKRVMKHGTTFAFTGDGKRIEVEGTLLLGAPEERIKQRHSL